MTDTDYSLRRTADSHITRIALLSCQTVSGSTVMLQQGPRASGAVPMFRQLRPCQAGWRPRTKVFVSVPEGSCFRMQRVG